MQFYDVCCPNYLKNDESVASLGARLQQVGVVGVVGMTKYQTM